MSKTLAKEFGLLRVDRTAGTFTLRTDISADGWKQLTPGAYVNRTYFDLAGISMEDKTLFFEGAALQETLNPTNVPSTPGNLTTIVDIMSNKPLDDTDALGAVTFGNTSASGGAKLTFDQTTYMRLRVFVVDLDTQAGGYFIPLSDNQLGSLSPTASDRVYVTRVVSFTPVANDVVLAVYPVRYLLRANAKEEPEFEYLMRLKRSYELQQEPDVD
jgi:hypothetical protein